MIGHMNTQTVSLRCELLNVCANYITGKTTLFTEGRYGVSPQCELSNVSAIEMIGKTTLYTGGRNGVSHQLIVKMSLYTEGR